MTQKENNTVNTILSATRNHVLAIADRRGITIDREAINARLRDSWAEWFERITAEIATDCKSADIFGHIPSGRIDPLVLRTAAISLSHACMKFAHHLLGINEVNQ